MKNNEIMLKSTTHWIRLTDCAKQFEWVGGGVNLQDWMNLNFQDYFTGGNLQKALNLHACLES